MPTSAEPEATAVATSEVFGFSCRVTSTPCLSKKPWSLATKADANAAVAVYIIVTFSAAVESDEESATRRNALAKALDFMFPPVGCQYSAGLPPQGSGFGETQKSIAHEADRAEQRDAGEKIGAAEAAGPQQDAGAEPALHGYHLADDSEDQRNGQAKSEAAQYVGR